MLAAPATPEGCESTPLPGCGDGRVEGGEQCEGAYSDSCVAHGSMYTSGTVRCHPQTCRYDYTDCTSAECGDGKAEGGESCDGADLRGVTSCTEIEFRTYVGGAARCGPNCAFDTSLCRVPVCGDGKVEGNEQCEAANLGATPTCATAWQAFAKGTLRCGSNCAYDFSECREPICGDGVIEEPEQCEGTNFGSETRTACTDYVFANSIFGVPTNYGSGNLACTNCRIDTTRCVPRPGCYWSSPGRTGPVPFCL